jgi:hypothetical protein
MQNPYKRWCVSLGLLHVGIIKQDRAQHEGHPNGANREDPSRLSLGYLNQQLNPNDPSATPKSAVG